MTRPSKRELERKLEELSGSTPTDSQPSVTIRHIAVDEDGDAAGVSETMETHREENGEWVSSRETYDFPNSRGGDPR